MRAFLFLWEKTVVPLGNQLERTVLSILSTGNVSGKKEYLQRYSSFLGFAGIIGISLYYLRRHTSTMLFDEMRVLFCFLFFLEKLYCSIWLKILTGFFHAKVKRSLLNGTYSSRSSLFVENLYCSI